jgi:hypothetical protein
MLDKWMKLNDTDPDLRECIYEFSMGRGGLLMEEICIENGYDKRYKVMARAQDSIGTFGRAMERHGIIVVAASALATAGHQDGGESTRG